MIGLDGVHRVFGVADGREALDYLHSGAPRPCVVITDLMMPRMSGWDLLAAMRASSELRLIPTVVVSASAGIAEGIPVARYLAKPVHPEDLVHAVTSLCESFHRSDRALTFDGTSA